MNFIPKKSKEGNWVGFRKLGQWGEKWIESFLKKENIKTMPLNLYTMCDESTEPMLWEDLKKYPKIPDFIARKENSIFLFDVKTKRKYDNSQYHFWINKRDYLHYLKFLPIISVKIYFVFVNHKPVEEFTEKDIKGIFLHEVKDNKYPEEYNKKDKNVVLDVKDSKCQIW